MPHKDWTRHGIQHSPAKPEYPEIFDTIVIGSGPAGMTAAIYAARRKMTILLITGPEIGGQMRWSSDIENYTGVLKSTGPALSDKFFHHVEHIEKDYEHFDLWIRREERATKVKEKGKYFQVTTDAKRSFSSRTVIITAGKVPRTLNIPGEDIAMQGNGLSFCATCDAPLYKDKKMAIIGGGNSAMDVALQLAKFTDDITVFTDLDHLVGETVLMEKIEQSPHIHVKYNIAVSEILLNADNSVCGITYSEANGKKQTFECEGIFEEIGQIPATGFLDSFLNTNAKGEVPVDQRCRTEIEGVFAAGDVTDELHKQIIVAAGQGAIAALEAHEYILNSPKHS